MINMGNDAEVSYVRDVHESKSANIMGRSGRSKRHFSPGSVFTTDASDGHG
jgi:hypothetical protein